MLEPLRTVLHVLDSLGMVLDVLDLLKMVLDVVDQGKSILLPFPLTGESFDNSMFNWGNLEMSHLF